MSQGVVTWLRWLLPFFGVALLLWAMRSQFLPAVPVAIGAIVAWLFLLPKPRIG